MTQTGFGRRTTANTPQAPLPLMSKFARPGQEPPRVPPPAPSVDEELKQWKKARGFTFPLKSIALMASLCFAIGSFALPANVNDWAQYPLYALSAASLLVGLTRRKPKP